MAVGGVDRGARGAPLEAAPHRRRVPDARSPGCVPTAGAAGRTQLGAEVAGGAGDEQRSRRSERALHVRHRSAVSSQPAERRMKPSGTSSPPQRARRSARRVDAAEAGRLGDELARRRGSARRARRAEVERRRPCRSRSSGAARPRARVLGQARIAHAAHVVAGREQLGDRERVGAPALEPHASVASERWASQVSNGPGIAPVLACASRAAPGRARRRAWPRSPSSRSACPDICLVALVSAKSRAQVQRPLAERPSRGVVHHAAHRRRARPRPGRPGRRPRGSGFDGRLEPEHRAPCSAFASSLRRGQPHLHPARLEVSLGDSRTPR